MTLVVRQRRITVEPLMVPSSQYREGSQQNHRWYPVPVQRRITVEPSMVPSACTERRITVEPLMALVVRQRRITVEPLMVLVVSTGEGFTVEPLMVPRYVERRITVAVHSVCREKPARWYSLSEKDHSRTIRWFSAGTQKDHSRIIDVVQTEKDHSRTITDVVPVSEKLSQQTIDPVGLYGRCGETGEDHSRTIDVVVGVEPLRERQSDRERITVEPQVRGGGESKVRTYDKDHSRTIDGTLLVRQRRITVEPLSCCKESNHLGNRNSREKRVEPLMVPDDTISLGNYRRITVEPLMVPVNNTVRALEQVGTVEPLMVPVVRLFRRTPLPPQQNH